MKTVAKLPSEIISGKDKSSFTVKNLNGRGFEEIKGTIQVSDYTK